MTLEKALAALEADDEVGLLSALTDAWRGTPHPRIAELAKRVSRFAAAHATPVQGKTLAARSEDWLSRAPAADDVTKHVLLAEPWPGKWRDAMPWLDAMIAWPPDPRIADRLIATLRDPPYTSQASFMFRRKVVARLRSFNDARAAEVLEAGITPPALHPKDEAALAKLEARFPEEQGAASQDDFLAAIYAGDRSGISVFADWLTERGDVRGELITLGCARAEGRATPAMERRERSLIAKVSEDKETWDWPAAKSFKRGTRRYAEGFFDGGLLQKLPEGPLDRSWARVRTVELTRADDPVPKGPLRALYNVSHPSALALLEGDELAALEELEIFEEDPTGDDDPIRSCTKAPALKRFGFARPSWSRATEVKVASWPVLQRVDTLFLRLNHPFKAMWSALTKTAVLRIEVRRSNEPFLDDRELFVLTREGKEKPFRTLRAHASDIVSVIGMLDSLPEKSIDRLELESRYSLSADRREWLDKSLSRFPGLVIDPPLDAEAEAPVIEGETAVARACFETKGALTEKGIQAILEHCASLGLTFDSFEVGYSSTHRKLKEKEAATQLAGWAKKSDRIEVYRNGAEQKVTLLKESIRLEALVAADRVDGLGTWLRNVLDDTRLAITTAAIGGVDDELRHRDFDTYNVFGCGLGHVLAISGEWRERLESIKGAIATKRHLLFELSKKLREPTPKAPVEWLSAEIHRAVDAAWKKQHGYDWRTVSTAPLEKAFKALGFGGEPTIENMHHRLTFANKSGSQRLSFGFSGFFEKVPVLHARLEAQATMGFYVFDLGRDEPAGSKADAKAALEKFAAAALEEGPAWLASPGAPQKRKGSAKRTFR